MFADPWSGSGTRGPLCPGGILVRLNKNKVGINLIRGYSKSTRKKSTSTYTYFGKYPIASDSITCYLYSIIPVYSNVDRAMATAKRVQLNPWTVVIQ
jgi:hypothetical protein